MEKFTYEEALCSILSKICTPITQRKDPDLFCCGQIVKERLIKDGTWDKIMKNNVD